MIDMVEALKITTESELDTLDDHDVDLLTIVKALRKAAGSNPPSVQITMSPSRARMWAAYFEELLMLRHGAAGETY